MKFHLNRFLRRVRIHGGEFDTSARAMYREGVTSSLRADLRIVRGSTIERKQMSTKTTIKRLALVTVAALGLGVLSVAPSNAAAQLDSLAISAATSTQVAGETLTATAAFATASFAGTNGVDTMTVTATLTKAPAFIAVHLATKETTTATVNSSGSSAVEVVTNDTTTITQGTAKLSVYLNNPTVAGDYVVKLTPTGTPNAAAVTLTITVAAKVIGWNTAFIGPETATAKTADAAVSTTSAAKIGSVAQITVAHGYGTTAGTDTITVAAEALAVTVTTDKGLVSKTNDLTAASKSVATAAGVAGTNNYYVFANGDVGEATITIKVGTRTAITKNVTFTGPATTLVAVPTAAAPLWTTIAMSTNESTTITATDVAGSVVSIPSGLTVTSSDTAVATVTISSGVVTVVPLTAGNATITVTDPATTAAATSVSFPVHVAPVKSKVAPVISFDKPAYNVGELVTMTITSDMGDSATATLFDAALVGSATVVASGTAHTGATHAIAGGKVTYKFYAPVVSGTWTVTGTAGADVDLTDLVTAPVITKTIDIINPGVDAATAAAELAEAAAQDATDAALDATEAATLAGALAQEAVDAVADLSVEVTKLIGALKAQITKLTNLVIKIQKKIK